MRNDSVSPRHVLNFTVLCEAATESTNWGGQSAQSSQPGGAPWPILSGLEDEEENRAIMKAWGQQLPLGFQAYFFVLYNCGEALWFMFGRFIEQRSSEDFANLLSGHSSSLSPGKYFYLLIPLKS